MPERRIVELSRNRDRYMLKHHSPGAARAVRWLTAWTYALRSLAALVLPGHSPRRYWRHVTATLRPDRGEGLREAASSITAADGGSEPPHSTHPTALHPDAIPRASAYITSSTTPLKPERDGQMTIRNRAAKAAVGAALLAGASGVAAQSANAYMSAAMQVTKVERIAGITGGFDGNADFFSKLWVGPLFTQSGVIHDQDAPATNWRLKWVGSPSAVETAPLTVEIRDYDSTSANDHADISPLASHNLELGVRSRVDGTKYLVHRMTGAYVADLSTTYLLGGQVAAWGSPNLTSTGTAADRARVTYNVKVAQEPDFQVSAISKPSASQVSVQVYNGGGIGIVTRIICTSAGRTVELPLSRTVTRFGSFGQVVNLAHSGSVTCTVRGINVFSELDAITTNNSRTIG